MTRREDFLRSFLGALGARELIITRTAPDLIEGIVIYNPDDPEERQGFRWRASDAEVPAQPIHDLATLLRDHRLLDVDRIRISREKLRDLYLRIYDPNVSVSQFDEILDALEALEIPMVDEGEETDRYFIHE